jgi:hypothetical protein
VTFRHWHRLPIDLYRPGGQLNSAHERGGYGVALGAGGAVGVTAWGLVRGAVTAGATGSVGFDRRALAEDVSDELNFEVLIPKSNSAGFTVNGGSRRVMVVSSLPTGLWKMLRAWP